MLMLEFNVTGQDIERTDKLEPVADSVDYLHARFTFSTSEWDGLTKTAIFTSPNKGPYEKILDEDNTCVVPHEVLTCSSMRKKCGVPLSFTVSVYGTKGTMRVTADEVGVGLKFSGFAEGKTPEPPTPTVYEQILEKLGESSDGGAFSNHFANALKDHASGARVTLSGVSPVKHHPVVKVSGEGVDLTTVTVVSGIEKQLPITGSFAFRFFQCQDLKVEGRGPEGEVTLLGANDLAEWVYKDIDNNPNSHITIKAGSRVWVGGSPSNNKDVCIRLVTTQTTSIAEGGLQGDYFGSQLLTVTEDTVIERVEVGVAGNANVDGVVLKPVLLVDPVTYTPEPDGTVKGVESRSPSMVLLTDNDAVVIDCEYNRDIHAMVPFVITATPMDEDLSQFSTDKTLEEIQQKMAGGCIPSLRINLDGVFCYLTSLCDFGGYPVFNGLVDFFGGGNPPLYLSVVVEEDYMAVCMNQGYLAFGDPVPDTSE